MANVAIDQLFQITTPTPIGQETPRVDSADGDRFRAHLDRAANAADAKQAPAASEEEPKSIESNDSLQADDGHEDTATAEHDDATSQNEAIETTSSTTDDTPSAEETGDEVTISAAAAAQPTEVVAAAEPTVANESFVGLANAGGDDQSEGGTAQQQASASQQSATSSIEEYSPIDATSPSNATKQSSNPQHNQEVATDATIPSVTTHQTELSSVTAGASVQVAASQPTAQRSTDQPKNGQTTPGKQTPIVTATDLLPENQADEAPPQESANRSQVVPTLLSSVTTATDESESALAAPTDTAEPATDQPVVRTTSTTSEIASLSVRNANGTTEVASNTNNGSIESPGQETTTVDRARFVQRVSGAIRSAQARDGQIQLRLSPPELGTLKIQLTVNEGAITAHLEAESAAARSVILDNLPALRERLAEQEITIEKFDVDVGQDEGQQTDNRSPEERQAKQTGNRTTDKRTSGNDPTTSPPDINTATDPLLNDGLDVRI